MQKDYTLYKADDLLQDDFFLETFKHPTAETEHFWNEQVVRNPALEKEIKLAGVILSGLERSTSQKDEFIDARLGILKENIDIQNRKQDRYVRNLRFLSMGGLAAAAVALLLFVLNLPAPEEVENVIDYNSIARNFDSLPDDDPGQIRLMLSQDKELIIEDEEVNIDYSQQDRIQLKSGDKEIAEEKEEDAIRFNQLWVPKGKRSFLILSDGTRVWVNSDSRIIYPERFAGGKREIYLEGEIYLDVVHDATSPFSVKTPSMDITVLGTEFNVSAYREDDEQYVVLVDGKVEVNVKGKDPTLMRPEEKFTLDTIGAHVTHVDIYNYVSWKYGYYQFRQEKLSTVFDKLSRFYGIEFSYSDDRINTLTCSGKLDLTDHVEEVLTILQKAAPIKAVQRENIIYIDVKP